MNIYIGVKYFQIIHYYYFCMGIFSFTVAIIFGFPYYLYFIMFYILHSGISWYVALFMEKKMKKFVVIQSSGYMVSHALLTVLTSGMTLVLWSYNILIEKFLIDSIIYINYYIFFLGLLWYVMTRFDVVSELFAYFDSLTLKRAKKLILNKREKLKLRKLITDIKIKSYEPGSEPEIDSILISTWRKRKSRLVRNIYEFETKMCESIIKKFRDRIEKLRSEPVTRLTDQKMIKSYENFIQDYEKTALEYEKFFSKRGEF
ncbi:MAG: hypothetical protein KAU24_01960 [Candidatus Aenigmarchaeota archaeon]|nr:hypothetical protein [Candidatus Aenigmarchaeota archaeon]